MTKALELLSPNGSIDLRIEQEILRHGVIRFVQNGHWITINKEMLNEAQSFLDECKWPESAEKNPRNYEGKKLRAVK